jgi:hypothetical protein
MSTPGLKFVLTLLAAALATSASAHAAQRVAVTPAVQGAPEQNPPAGAQAPQASRGDKSSQEPRFAAVPTEAEWHNLIERDRRLSFTDRTAAEARGVLDSPESTEERRAIAAMALGCSGSVVERARLERTIKIGSDLERRAAILALGEMSAGPDDLLDTWVTQEPEPIAECALLSWLRCDRGAGRRRVEEMASDPKQRLSHAAGDLLVFVFDPSASRPSRAGALLLRLRWEAARDYGLVDGESWQGLIVRRYSKDTAFMTDLVLSAAPRLHSPALRDHVFALLQSSTSPARLRAAVDVLPIELSNLVENDLWKPKNADEWNVVVDEIEVRSLERLTLPILRAATDVPSVRYRAIALSSLAGDEELTALTGLDASKITPEERVQVCLAIGARQDASWIERFAAFAEDRNPRVRASFTVAAYRLGNKKAAKAIAAILGDNEHAEHAVLVNALGAAVRDPGVAVLLENRFLEAEGAEKTQIATFLCLDGRLVGRAQVRAALSTEPPPTGIIATRLVRALRKNSSAEDLDVFKSLFPTETDRFLDRELALALLERGEPVVMPLMRAAIWQGDLDLSLIAAGVLADLEGVRALFDELRVPPMDASSNDLRRLGFAIGEWGGVQALENLARDLRYSSGNPALQGALLGFLSTRTQ